jgi:hypothetical protein
VVIAALWTEGEFRRWDCGGGWHDIIHRDGPGLSVDRRGVEEGLWGIEAKPPFSFFIGLKIGVAGFVVVRHGAARLAMKGAVGFAAEVGVFQGMGVGFGAVGSGAGGEDRIIALAYKALIEEGGK